MRVKDTRIVSKIPDPYMPEGYFIPLVDNIWWEDGMPWYQVVEENETQFLIEILEQKE